MRESKRVIGEICSFLSSRDGEFVSAGVKQMGNS